MANVLDVADYFLSRIDRESGDLMTKLRLQKLVYYTQSWSMVFRAQPLFDEEVQAWVDGPAVYSVWKKYTRFDTNVIDEVPNIRVESFQDDELNILDLIWDVYGKFNATQLWKLSHSEDPWCKARSGLSPDANSRTRISLEDMRIYYSPFGGIKDNCLFIEDRVTKLNKCKETVLISLQDGTQEYVGIHELGVFISKNAENLQYEQGEISVEGIDLF